MLDNRMSVIHKYNPSKPNQMYHRIYRREKCLEAAGSKSPDTASDLNPRFQFSGTTDSPAWEDLPIFAGTLHVCQQTASNSSLNKPTRKLSVVVFPTCCIKYLIEYA